MPVTPESHLWPRFFSQASDLHIQLDSFIQMSSKHLKIKISETKRVFSPQILSPSTAFSSMKFEVSEPMTIPFSISTLGTYKVVNYSLASAVVTYNSQGWHLGKINIA